MLQLGELLVLIGCSLLCGLGFGVLSAIDGIAVVFQLGQRLASSFLGRRRLLLLLRRGWSVRKECVIVHRLHVVVGVLDVGFGHCALLWSCLRGCFCGFEGRLLRSLWLGCGLFRRYFGGSLCLLKRYQYTRISFGVYGCDLPSPWVQARSRC